MEDPFELYDLPAGYKPCLDIDQLCMLKRQKKIWKKENITRRNGQIIYIYSEIHKKYYKRILQPYLPDEKLQPYIDRQLLYYKPIK